MAEPQPCPKVPVVEDSEAAREGLAATLRRAGYGVETAAHGGEALERVRSDHPPDLILLDMLMPVLDGWHFLGRLCQAGPHPPVVLTTGTAVLGRDWARDHGCAGFLRKPVEAEELLEEVRRVLG